METVEKDAKTIRLATGWECGNEASEALHRKFGFRDIGHLKEAGFKFKKWVDVGYWQLLL
jgi:phosphinothricin acetyltransferase